MRTLFKNEKHYRVFGLRRGGKTADMSLSNSRPTVETKFRYFMLAIKSVHSGTLVQFCKLRFYRGENPNDCFPWCNDMILFSDINTYVAGIKEAGAVGSSGENLINGLVGMGGPAEGKDHDEVDGQPGTYYLYGKLCYDRILSYDKDTAVKDSRGNIKIYRKYETINGEHCACFAYDIDNAGIGKLINTKDFNKWCWYSANDTYADSGTGEGKRNMTKFDLYMSNDRETWYLMDSGDIESPKNKGNYQMIYSNQIYPHFTEDEITKQKKYITINLKI